MTGDTEFEELLAQALEIQDEGGTLDLDLLCRGNTACISRLREALGMADAISGVGTEGGEKVLANRYRLDVPLGSGAMGVVYSASDVELGRRVAVKVLRSDLLSGEEFAHRFDREAEVLAAIDHPNVVRVFDRGQDEQETRYLVTELLSGSPLSDLVEDAAEDARGTALADRNLDWIHRRLARAESLESTSLRQIVHWCAALADGLEAAHRAGIFHRDVKPSNVMIVEDGRAVLIDFGIATLDSEATLASRDGVLGTPAYLAPERLDDDGSGSSRASDVYGLGATLYHLVTGQAPYTGTPSQIFARLHRADPRPAARLRPGLPRDLRAILDAALARDPRARYPSAAVFAADLRAFLTHEPLSVRPLGPTTRTWRFVRRSREVRAGLAVAIALVLAWSAWVWWQGAEAQRRDEWRQGFGRVSPTAVLLPTGSRTVAEERIIQSTLDQLAPLASTDVEAFPAIAVRALFRFDHKRGDRGVGDVSELHRRADTEYTREVLAKIRAAAADGSDVVAEPSDLPEPVSTIGAYFHALLLIRTGKPVDAARAAELLDAVEGADRFAVRELALQARFGLLASITTDSELVDRCRSVQSEAIRLEADLGYRTAATAKCLGGSYVAERRFDEAVEVLGDGLELAPDDVSMRVNLGKALRDRDLAAACEHFDFVGRAYPGAIGAQELYVRSLIARGDYATALEVVPRIPYRSESAERRQRYVGLTEIGRLQVALRANDAAEVDRAALAAFQAFKLAKRHNNPFETVVAFMVARRKPAAVPLAIDALDPRHEPDIELLELAFSYIRKGDEGKWLLELLQRMRADLNKPLPSPQPQKDQ